MEHKDPNAIVRIAGGLTENATGGREPSENFKEALKNNPDLENAYLEGAEKAQREKLDKENE